MLLPPRISGFVDAPAAPDPEALIREARERQRRRRRRLGGVVVAAAILAGGTSFAVIESSGGTGTSGGSGRGAGGHSAPDAFSKNNSTEAGGYPVLESAPTGLTLRFIPSTPFGVGIVIRNRSKQAVTLEDVRAVVPAGSLIHQIGTRLLAWNPPPCPKGRSCPGFGFLRGPFSAARPSPLPIAPGRAAGAQLNFQLGGCGAVPFASATPVRDIVALYRTADGVLVRQLLPLGASQLKLRMPKPSDCAPRPRSQISIEGEFATSSAWTIPGSTGDTCTRTAGGRIVFTSRTYEGPASPMMRIKIVLPHFAGAGLYRTLPRAAPARGPAQVLAIAGIGIHGWTTFRGPVNVVTATHVGGSTLGGRFHATLVGRHGAPFRVFGAWRCATS